VKTKLNKKNVIVLAVAVLIVAFVLSSVVYLNSQRPNVGRLESVAVGMEPNPVNLLMYIAQNQNYFSNNGLNVTIKDYSSGAAATNGLLNGEVNVSIATELVLTRNILSNSSIQTFGSTNKFLQSYIIAKKDSGIANISDLRGKTIGVTLQTNSQFYVGRFLELNNLGLNDVNLTNVPPSQFEDALVNGTVDALVAWQPYIGGIQNRLGNDNVVMWDVQSGQPAYGCIISTNNWIADNPQQAKNFLAALAQAEDYALNNPSEAKTLLENWLNLSATYVQTIWHQYSFSLSLDQAQLLAMQDEAQWLINNNQTNATALPNFLNYIYLDGLEAVDPNAVTIVK
jgi:ABC-type nitrate/sulfonate/bicarbonate transport system substrate-binding protein